MRIVGKTLHCSIEHDVTLGHNNAIECTINHQVFIFENKEGKLDMDLDFCDVTNVRFMGLPIENGYKALEKFKKQMGELGFDINKMLNEKAASLITDEQMEELKAFYKQSVA